jgi:hypothetical protein
MVSTNTIEYCTTDFYYVRLNPETNLAASEADEENGNFIELWDAYIKVSYKDDSNDEFSVVGDYVPFEELVTELRKTSEEKGLTITDQDIYGCTCCATDVTENMK